MITERLLDMMEVEAEVRAQRMATEFAEAMMGPRRKVKGFKRPAPQPMPAPMIPTRTDSAEDEMGIEE